VNLSVSHCLLTMEKISFFAPPDVGVPTSEIIITAPIPVLGLWSMGEHLRSRPMRLGNWYRSELESGRASLEFLVLAIFLVLPTMYLGLSLSSLQGHPLPPNQQRVTPFEFLFKKPLKKGLPNGR